MIEVCQYYGQYGIFSIITFAHLVASFEVHYLYNNRINTKSLFRFYVSWQIFFMQQISKITHLCSMWEEIFYRLFQSPNPAEPPYVAKARLEILSLLRETRQMDNTECRILINNFNTALKHIDQVAKISHNSRELPKL